MRTLSTEFRTNTQAQQTGAVYLTLLDIDYDSNPSDPLRFVNNFEAITYSGNAYSQLAFNFTMPQDGTENRSASIELDNVDRRVSEFILRIGNEQIYITERLIDASDTEDIVVEITREYTLKNVTITRTMVTGELSYMQNLQDAFPKLRKVPSKFPGVF
jgi:hypothetical protein